jgi:hypothetical protein
VLFWFDKPEGKRPLGRPSRRWEDIVRTDLSEIGWVGVNWMYQTEDRDQWQAVVNTKMNVRDP